MAFVVMLLVVLGNWGTTLRVSYAQTSASESKKKTPRILLMTPDVKYYLLTAGGVSEPQAEWTEASRKNIVSAIWGYKARAIQLVILDESSEFDDLQTSYEKLHFAVGRAILTHHYGQFKLPSKGGKLDWSLGPGISAVGENYGADYALFTYYRDYTSSGGRVAFAILAAVAGVGVAGGGGVGFASLVDLKSGDVLSFKKLPETNFLSGEGAANAINKLLNDMLPK
jgi:hypothetical protein